MRGVKKYNRHEEDVVERVYDKILAERGIKLRYDIELDRNFVVNDNRFMKTGGEKLAN